MEPVETLPVTGVSDLSMLGSIAGLIALAGAAGLGAVAKGRK